MKPHRPYDHADDARAYLGTRAANCVWNATFINPKKEPRRAAEMVAKLTRQEVLRWPNFGPRTLPEIEAWLAYFGLALIKPPNDTRCPTCGRLGYYGTKNA